jgi:hypothetical protein
LNKQNGIPTTASRRSLSSTESLQYTVDNAAVLAVSAAVTNCMQGVTSSQTDAEKEATRTACRTTTAKTQIATSLAVLESTISANTVTEFVWQGAVLAVGNAIAACTTGSTGTALITCIAATQASGATAQGVAAIGDMEFKAYQHRAGLSQVESRTLACVEAGTTSTCDYLAAYAANSGDQTVLSDADKDTAKVAVAYAAGTKLLKENLVACQLSLTAAGATRTVAEIETCSTSLSSDALAALGITTSNAALSLEESQRILAGDRMESCVAADSTSTTCTTEAMTYMQEFTVATLNSTHVAGALLVQYSEFYSLALGAVGSMGCEDADSASCVYTTSASLLPRLGGAAAEQGVVVRFNAIRAAARTLASCNGTSATSADCEAQALVQFTKLGGDPTQEQWDAEYMARTRDIADAYMTGATSVGGLKIIYSDYVDVYMTVNSTCTSLNAVEFTADMTAAVSAIDPALSIAAIDEPYDSNLAATPECTLNYQIAVSSSTMEMADIVAAAQSLSVTVVSRRSMWPWSDRRSSSSSATAAQTVTLCDNKCSISSSDSSNSSSDFPLWAIPLIIVGALLCVAATVIIFVMRNRKMAQKNAESREPLTFHSLTQRGLNAADDVALEPPAPMLEQDSPQGGDGIIAANEGIEGAVRVGPPA